MKTLDFSISNSQIADEIINVANSNAINLLHDVFYNKAGKLMEIWTGAGGTGTQLTLTTDYTVGDAYTDGDLPTSIAPDVAYTTLSIVNAGYHSTDLYVSYYPIGDIINASRWNTDIPVQALTATAAAYTITSVLNNVHLTFTRDGSARVITFPDATESDHTGQRIAIKVVGAGAGNVSLASVGGQTLGGQTATDWDFDGTGTVIFVSDGVNWELDCNGIWDRVFPGYGPGDQACYKSTDGRQELMFWDFLNGTGAASAVIGSTAIIPFIAVVGIYGSMIGVKTTSDPTDITDYTGLVGDAEINPSISSLSTMDAAIYRNAGVLTVGNRYMYSIKIEGTWV